jgi:Catalase
MFFPTFIFMMTLLTAQSSELDTYLGEEYEEKSAKRESQLIRELSQVSINPLEKKYPRHLNQMVPRDVHGKSHGCLFGHIEIKNHSLPPYLRVGLFEKNQTYKTVLRYSSNDKRADFKDIREDIRGLGLKVMNIQNKLGNSQDFLFLASQEFFIKDNSFYLNFLKVLFDSSKVWSGLWLAYNDPQGALSVGIDMLKTTMNYKNPVDIPFFSAVPYRLGARFDKNGFENLNRRAVKYKIHETTCPDVPEEEKIQRVLSKIYEYSPSSTLFNPSNYLRENLKYRMEKFDTCLTLSIQIRDQRDKFKFPVEDPRLHWDIPFIKVAEIRLHSQDFDTQEMNLFCENLTFSPWNTLEEHRPLGRINRARKKIYEDISRYRHQRNGFPDDEGPFDFSFRTINISTVP